MAFITKISFPNNLEQLVNFLRVRDGDYNGTAAEMSDIYLLLESYSTAWTAPDWCKVGDIVFFMHTKISKSRLEHIEAEYEDRGDEYNIYARLRIEKALELERDLYKKYGGKIFAIGQVSGEVFDNNYASENNLHWKSRTYAPMSDIFILERPVDVSEFGPFIDVAERTAITPVFG